MKRIFTLFLLMLFAVFGTACAAQSKRQVAHNVSYTDNAETLNIDELLEETTLPPATAALTTAAMTAPSPTEQVKATSGTYILNTNTKKFHDPDCPSVTDMKEKNKQVFSGSRDEIIAQGYQPCQRCNP